MSKDEDEDIVIEEASEDGDSEEASNPAAALKKLREKLKVCQTERQEFLETSQRLKADYVNLRRDEEKRRVEMSQYAKANMLVELLDLADTFDMAFANKEAWESVNENWRKGVEYIHAKLLGIFEQNGLVLIDPLGAEFNPAEHHAVGFVPIDPTSPDGFRGTMDNKVLEVVQKGYKLNDRVLRPAKVKVGHKV